MENSQPQSIKRNSEFVSLKQNGERFWATKWLLVNYQPNTLNTFRFGVTASRKVGPAVVRNKLKRWCREYFRAFLKTGNPLEIDVNIIFKPIDQSFYRGLPHDEFVKAMDRAVGSIRKGL